MSKTFKITVPEETAIFDILKFGIAIGCSVKYNPDTNDCILQNTAAPLTVPIESKSTVVQVDHQQVGGHHLFICREIPLIRVGGKDYDTALSEVAESIEVYMKFKHGRTCSATPAISFKSFIGAAQARSEDPLCFFVNDI